MARQGHERGVSRRAVAKAAGTFLSVGLPLVMLGMTVWESTFLQSVGWSAIHRTPTEWPSILALGPSGEVLTVAFAISTSSGLVLAVRVAGFSNLNWRGALVSLIVIASTGMAGVSFTADSPGAPNASWHGVIHNALYPLIPVGLVGSALVVACAGGSRSLQRIARVLVPAMCVTFALTNVDAIAQLARYFAFGTLFAWCGALGWLADGTAARSGDSC